jgi:hypothetical protein
MKEHTRTHADSQQPRAEEYGRSKREETIGPHFNSRKENVNDEFNFPLSFTYTHTHFTSMYECEGIKKSRGEREIEKKG